MGSADQTWSDTNAGSYLTFHTCDNGTIILDERMRIQHDGNVGIGVTAPDNTLHVVGPADSSYVARFDTPQASSHASGVLIKFTALHEEDADCKFLQCEDDTVEAKIDGDGAYTGSSDVRLKENIVDTESQLAKINQVRVVNYNRIKHEGSGADSRKHHIGIIAQELQEVYPHLVSVADDKQGTHMVYKTGLFAPMIKAIQELSAEIEKLKNK